MPSEAALLDLEERLLAFGVQHFSIREPDPPYFNQIMAIGFLPAPKGAYKKFLARLPLLKDQDQPVKNQNQPEKEIKNGECNHGN